MKSILKYIIIASLLFGASGFNSAKAITADELLVAIQSTIGQVNQIFAQIGQALGALDSRISNLETGTGVVIAVDCIADPLALKNNTLKPGNTYVLTGMCDGPLRIFEPAGTYIFQGDATGVKDDGIISPPGQMEDYVVSAFGPISIIFDNLTISGANYTSQSDVYVTTIHVRRNASVSLFNVDVVGGDWGVWADSAYLSIGSDVNITGFREYGLLAGNGGHVQIADFITVEGADNQPGGFSMAMDAYRNGSIAIDGGGIFSAGSDDGTNPDYVRDSMNANSNGSIRINGNVTLTGTIASYRNSEINIGGGGTIVGRISAFSQSRVSVKNVTHSGGSITSIGGSEFTAFSSTLSNGSSDDSIAVKQASTMRLLDTSVGNSSGARSIEVSHHGFLSLQGATNLNGRIIECFDPIQDIQLIAATGIGAGSCI